MRLLRTSFVLLCACNFLRIVPIPEELPGPSGETGTTGATGATGSTATTGTQPPPTITAVLGEDVENTIITGAVTLTGTNLASTTAVDLFTAAGATIGAFSITSTSDTTIVVAIPPALEAAIRTDASSAQQIRVTTPAGSASIDVRIEPGPPGPTGPAGIDPAAAAKVSSLVATQSCNAGLLATGLQPSGALQCSPSAVGSGVTQVSGGSGIVTAGAGGDATVQLSGTLPSGLAITHNSTIASPHLALQGSSASPPVLRLQRAGATNDARWEIVGDVQDGAETDADATLTMRYITETGATNNALVVTGDGRMITTTARLGSLQAGSSTGDGLFIEGAGAGPLVSITQSGAGEAMHVYARSELISTGASQQSFAAAAAPNEAPTATHTAANAMRLPTYVVHNTLSSAGTTVTATCVGAEDLVLSGGCYLITGRMMQAYPSTSRVFTCRSDTSGLHQAWALCLKGY